MKQIAIFGLTLLAIKGIAQPKYPATRIVDSSSTYWGVTYHDPYRWLENVRNPEVESWFKQQATYSDAVLKKISGRDELIAEYKIPIPTEKVIAQFHEKISPIFRSIQVNAKQNQELIQLRDFLLPLLMTGQVKVR